MPAIASAALNVATRLLDAALAGEKVVIAKAGKPGAAAGKAQLPCRPLR